MDYLPLFTRVADADCLVVGGGVVASRKISLLLKAGARVRVVAPQAVDPVRELAANGTLEWLERKFTPADVAGAEIVFAATSDDVVNADVAAAAAAAGCLCNVADNLELSTAILPAIIDRSPVIIAVSSGGKSPVLATQTRQRIEQMLPANFGKLADWAAGWRETVKASMVEPAARLRFWQQMLTGDAAAKVLANDTAGADAALQNELESQQATPRRGVGWLVGAGPGDPELLTLKALRCIETADVIIHDRLVAREILQHARRDAEIISAGKMAGRETIRQPEINELLVHKVQEGLRVCRLKGGDPFIFGRGGEEVEALAAAGLDFAVVPGITAAAGCAAALAVPLTHRNTARSVTYVTGHTATGAEPDWQRLAGHDQTVVIYMSLGNLEHTCERLIAAGRTPDCPALLVENGTTDKQRVLTGELAGLPELARTEAFGSPALLVVGEVAAWASAQAGVSNNEASPWLPAAGATHSLGT